MSFSVSPCFEPCDPVIACPQHACRSHDASAVAICCALNVVRSWNFTALSANRQRFTGSVLSGGDQRRHRSGSERLRDDCVAVGDHWCGDQMPNVPDESTSLNLIDDVT